MKLNKKVIYLFLSQIIYVRETKIILLDQRAWKSIKQIV